MDFMLGRMLSSSHDLVRHSNFVDFSDGSSKRSTLACKGGEVAARKRSTQGRAG